MNTLKTRIKHKNGSPTEWAQATNFMPLKGELIIYNDVTNPKIKIGDGYTSVNDLPFVNTQYVVADLGDSESGDDYNPEEALVNAETLGGKPASDYMLKVDTATNSNKLGGRAPEYYLQPRNLLDNSDFRNPVNQRGQTSYATAYDYAIDRWMVASGTLTVENGYITCGFTQQFILRGNYSGVYTLAAKKTDGTVLIHTQNIENNYAYTETDVAFGTFDDERIRITLPAGSYLWSALYEGTYTAETLPPYIPKGYAVELAECRRYYKKEYVNCWLEWFWTNSLRVAVNYEKMRINNPTIKLVNAKFINTNLNKWEQWIWINLMPYYTAQENQTPQSVLFVFTDNDNPFIEKMSYQGMIEYEINADL